MTDVTTFKETINLDRARILVSMPPKDIIDTFFDKNDKTNNMTPATYVSIIKKWLYDRICKGDSTYKTNYKYAKSMNMGRLFISPFGLQNTQNKIRSFLTPNLYSDIDIVNCHYSILLNILDKHNAKSDVKLDSVCIREYVNNRDHIIDMYNTDKRRLLVLLNSDIIHKNKKNGFTTKNNFEIKLHEEIDVIKTIFSKLEKNQYLYNESAKNPKSSMLNKIITIEENRLLQLAMSVLDQNQSIIPMFDGFHFEKIDDANKSEYEEKFNEITHDDDHHSVTWKFKEIEDNAMSDSQYSKYEELSKSVLSSTIKAEYDDKHLYIKSTGMFKIKCKQEDGTYAWYNHKRNNMIVDGANMHYVDKSGKLQSNYFLEWERDPDRRQYELEAYIPYPPNKSCPAPSHVFNTFKPMPIEYDPDYSKPNDSVLHAFLWGLASEREQEYNMLRSFLAQIVQDPANSRHKALILTSFKNRGTGKNTFQKLAERLLGFDNTYASAKIDDLMAKKQTSNGQLQDRLFITLNEISWKDSKDYVDSLKDLITSEISCVRKLYQETVKSVNYSRILITSNSIDCPIPLDNDNRRYEWIKAENVKHCGDKKYWSKVYKCINNDDWISDIGNELLRENLREDKIVNTDEMIESSVFNKSKEEMFIERIISSELRIRDKVKDGIMYIKIPDLYNRYGEFLLDYNETSSFSKQVFRKRICQIDGVFDQKLVTYKTSNGNKSKQRMYSFDIEKIKETLIPENEEDVIELDFTDSDEEPDTHY